MLFPLSAVRREPMWSSSLVPQQFASTSAWQWGNICFQHQPLRADCRSVPAGSSTAGALQGHPAAWQHTSMQHRMFCIKPAGKPVSKAHHVLGVLACETASIALDVSFPMSALQVGFLHFRLLSVPSTGHCSSLLYPMLYFGCVVMGVGYRRLHKAHNL